MKNSLKIILKRDDDKLITVTLAGVKSGLASQDVVALKSLIETDKVFIDGDKEIASINKFVAVEVAEREL